MNPGRPLSRHPRNQPLGALLLVLVLLSAPRAWAQGAATVPVATPAAATATPPPPAAQPTGLVTIESDSQKADNATGIITAIGNVRILYPDRRLVATSRQAQYFTKEGRIVLTGDVDVIQEGGNLLRAERVVYLVDSERVLAEPGSGQQVFSRLRLQQNNASPGTAAPR
ncbi:LPS-assembly protein LptD [Synechococcus sp. CS-1325]|uniref:LptA/OstA family protein n=1 Tax=unclassified Synechococcus TaxID=2626047 RepID=UPI000DB2F85F|nr:MULTISPECIES: LPS-assembly protein LptD [unclassified Synechococcus]PZV00262.1 MAG: organic solvent tolerance protein OstA [Cyanobium sp.]MCT0200852.1 LPS-assembly protein LptD [Synechococcus sp. CS-1325]MCT0213890.1 LPS-assembly protein LptD [Synechococcus sp. CS-1326]MCT0230792.1 LPS-assembly protein LptD [Synechococcus sp. CS-1324]MCT0233466.1 LPS-assembly protein LptD [Synechococcus sp. CS-1327]